MGSSNLARGHVVQIHGDIVRAAFPDESIHEVCKRGKLLKIVTRDGKSLVGIVASVELTDELYRQAKSISMFPESYEELILRKNDVLISIVGTLTESGIARRYDSIPSPGDRVEPLSKEELQKIFGSSRNSIRIGTLPYEDVEVSLDLNQLATKHTAILAMTGAGKSNTLATLVVRILSKLPSARILIIDTHSEYIGLSKLKEKGVNVNIFCPVGKFREIIRKSGISSDVLRDLEIPYWWLNIDEWFSLLGLTSQATAQRRILREGLRAVKKKLDFPVFFSLEDLKRQIEEGRKDQSRKSLLDKLEDAMDSEEYEFIFYPKESLKIRNDPKKVFRKVLEPIVYPGLKIVALGGIPSEIQTAVVSMLLRTLFRIAIETKLRGKVIPTMVAIEEAHIYAPGEYSSPSKSIIERIAKEGRKFGIGLIVISQRPKELSSTVLAQCGTLIALRIVNPSDQAHIIRSVEDMTSYMVSSLSGLGVGEALISGFAAPIPCIVQIDHFSKVIGEEVGLNIELGGRDIDVVGEWSREVGETEVQEVIDMLYRSYEEYSDMKKKSKENKQSSTQITQYFGVSH